MSIPRPEHPRPDFMRTPWLNLNGTWHFRFDPGFHGEQLHWHRLGAVSQSGATICVPFPWESALSGQGRTDYKGAGWYERMITIPETWTGLEPVLHFGAVDWEARVWVNGQLVAENRNGFLPFACNLGGLAAAGETVRVTVRAYDIAEATTLIGKQVPRWYTHSSGIWQTVWLEGRRPDFINRIRISPDIDADQAAARVTLTIQNPGTFVLQLASPEAHFEPVQVKRQLAAGCHEEELAIRIPEAQLWSPDNPFLYNVTAELAADTGEGPDSVTTYFGMRRFARGRYGDNDYEYLLLNDEPVYLRGALDQAFHPESLYAYPSDDAIRRDIELAREMGLNMLRCHIKINDPRYYYWADRLGVIIHYDMPSPDLDSPGMRALCAETIRGMVDRDFNHPSIMLWVLFNETWGLTRQGTRDGQEWVRSMYHLARQLDPTRLVEDNSPCLYDHVVTDVNSWHFYINDYARARSHIQHVVDQTFAGSAFNYIGEGNVQGHEPLMNSEYGGISAAMGDMDISWCFKYLTTELRRHARICGYVYTELADIEWEHNGFVKYDRSRKFFGYEAFVEGMSVVDLNAAQLVGLDCPPCQTIAPGGTFAAPLFVSNWGHPLDHVTIEWEATLVDRMGRERCLQAGTVSMVPTHFDVVESEAPLAFAVGTRSGLATVALRLLGPDGECLNRNYVNFEISGGPSPREEMQDPSSAVVRFAPGTYTHCSWPVPARDGAGRKVAGMGPGFLEYRIPIPETVNPVALARLDFMVEIGARAHMAEKLSWPPRNWRQHTPQTMEKKFPSRVAVSVNGVLAATLELDDDPADARGVLSHYHEFEPGSYGSLHTITLSGRELAALALGPDTRTLVLRLDAAAAGSARGFSVYGEQSGRYPVDPTVIFTLDAESGHK